MNKGNAEKKPMFSFKLLAMLAETSVHAGSGAELGAVDLPIQRERHTSFPTIHGSGIKGVLRDLSEGLNGDGWSTITETLFGSKPPEAGEVQRELKPGVLVVSDARLLLFPMRTIGPAFAWVTCPFAIARLKRDIGEVGSDLAKNINIEVLRPQQNKAIVAANNEFPAGKVILEEFEFEAEKKPEVGTLVEVLKKFLPGSDGMNFWKKLIEKNVVVVSDDDFRDFVSTATEVVTRVRLSEEKTVKEGLWTEEYLPADTLLYSLLGIEGLRYERFVLSKKGKNEESKREEENGWVWIRDIIEARPLVQFGGKETVGRGFMRLHLWPEGGSNGGSTTR